jgi:hypothetical protein
MRAHIHTEGLFVTFNFGGCVDSIQGFALSIPFSSKGAHMLR